MNIAIAANWDVSPILLYVGKYKTAREIILDAIRRHKPELSIPEQLAMFEREMTKQKQLFEAERTEEYKSKVLNLSKHAWVTSGSTDGAITKIRRITAPSTDLHIIKDTVTKKGSVKQLRVYRHELTFKVGIAGKGKKRGEVSADFRFIPEVITERVRRDSIELFNIVNGGGSKLGKTRKNSDVADIAFSGVEHDGDLYFWKLQRTDSSASDLALKVFEGNEPKTIRIHAIYPQGQAFLLYSIARGSNGRPIKQVLETTSLTVNTNFLMLFSRTGPSHITGRALFRVCPSQRKLSLEDVGS